LPSMWTHLDIVPGTTDLALLVTIQVVLAEQTATDKRAAAAD